MLLEERDVKPVSKGPLRTRRFVPSELPGRGSRARFSCGVELALKVGVILGIMYDDYARKGEKKTIMTRSIHVYLALLRLVPERLVGRPFCSSSRVNVANPHAPQRLCLVEIYLVCSTYSVNGRLNRIVVLFCGVFLRRISPAWKLCPVQFKSRCSRAALILSKSPAESRRGESSSLARRLETRRRLESTGCRITS